MGLIIYSAIGTNESLWLLTNNCCGPKEGLDPMYASFCPDGVPGKCEQGLRKDRRAVKTLYWDSGDQIQFLDVSLPVHLG